MTENGAAEPQETNGQAPAQGTQQVKLQILGQYIRDLSFENILARKGVQGEVAPEISVQVNLDVRKRQAEGQFEVISKFTITSKNKSGEETLFLLELEYGGLFQISGVPDEQLHPFLLIECPRMLFPFVRRIVSDVTRDGGFPALNLEVIDFMQLYRQSLAQRQAAKAAEQPAVS